MLSFLFFSALSFADEWEYGVIIDAGSSGTRLQTYKWQKGSSLHLPIPVGKVVKSSIPLHLAYYRPEFIEQIFKEIMNEAVANVPLEAQPDTYLYCFSTAGMRSIESKAREKVLSDCRKYLRENYNFKIEDAYVSTITPQEEGIYAWIAVNVLEGFFNNKQPVPVTEIGSQSAQIVFQTDDKSSAYSKYVYNVTVANVQYQVFCYSYPHLGLDEVETNYTNGIAQDVGRSAIESPCYPKDTQISLRYIDIKGTGDYDKCYDDLSKYSLLHDSKCSGKFCAFEGLAMPASLSGKNLHALSVHAYPAQAFQLSSKLSENIEFARSYCQKTSDELTSEYKDITNEYLYKYCIEMAFSYNWLVRGLGIDKDEDVVRIWESKVGDDTVTVGWPYGAIIARASATEAVVIEPVKGWNKGLIALAGIIMCLLIIVVIAIAYIKYRRKKRQEREMEMEVNNYKLDLEDDDVENP